MDNAGPPSVPPTGAPLPPSVEASTSNAPKRWFKRLNKKIAVPALLLLVVVALAAYWFAIHNNKSYQKVAVKLPSQTSIQATASPHLNAVQAYANFAGVDWYGSNATVVRIANNKPTLYTQNNGVPTGPITSLAVHDNKLWLGTMAGVAMLAADQSQFNSVNLPESPLGNGRLYTDSDTGSLYLSTFNSFYKYNDSTSKWDQQSGPANVFGANNFVANSQFVAVNANASGAPVWVMNKQKNTWQEVKPTNIDDQVAQLFKINDTIFLMGRSKGYDSCDGSGKVTATSIDRLDSSGNWQPINDFNSDISRPEIILVSHVKDPSIKFYTSPCGGETQQVYPVSYTNGEIVLGTPTKAPEGAGSFMGEGDSEQQDLVNYLSKITDLYPYTRLEAIEKNGDYIYSYSSVADGSSNPFTQGLAYGKNFTKAQSHVLKLDGGAQSLYPILCDGQMAYVFAGIEEDGEGGPTGAWTSAVIYKVNGTEVTKFVDLNKDVSDPIFACTGNKISWAGQTKAMQLDLTTKVITTISGALTPDYISSVNPGQVVASTSGNLWILPTNYDSKGSISGNLYLVDAAKATTTKLAAVTANDRIIAADDSRAWVSTNQGKNIVEYDASGKKITSLDTNHVIDGVVLPSGALVVALGQTQDVFTSYSLSEFSVSGQKAGDHSLATAAFHSLYVYGGSNILKYDEIHKVIWISDDTVGLFPVSL